MVPLEPCFYTVDPKSVIFERFDNEVIAIHLRRGTYYSLNTTGAEIFELAAAQASRETILSALVKQYDEPEKVAEEAAGFLDLLENEGLIQRTAAAPPQSGALSVASDPKRSFVAPTLSVHRDMQDLFLLDPVHDVGKAGWPEPAPTEK